MIKLSIAEGIIYRNSFNGYTPEHPKAEQKYLTREELDHLIKTRLDHPFRYLTVIYFYFQFLLV
jgi:hypothetical protein